MDTLAQGNVTPGHIFRGAVDKRDFYIKLVTDNDEPIQNAKFKIIFQNSQTIRINSDSEGVLNFLRKAPGTFKIKLLKEEKVSKGTKTPEKLAKDESTEDTLSITSIKDKLKKGLLVDPKNKKRAKIVLANKILLEIQIIGTDGQPASNKAFKLTFPDGTQIEGYTNRKGFIKEEIPYIKDLKIGLDIDIEEENTEENNFDMFQEAEPFNDPEISSINIPKLDFRGVKRYDYEKFEVKDIVVLNVYLVEEKDSTPNAVAKKYGVSLDELKEENVDGEMIVFLNEPISENFSLSKEGITVG